MVYPLVEESEKTDLQAAIQGADACKRTSLPTSGRAVHGRMKSEEKEQLWPSLRRSDSVLVATTVVEVGVDVPNATVMMIEHAERFGLAQLHQLRGRVGRSGYQSYCLLMASGVWSGKGVHGARGKWQPSTSLPLYPVSSIGGPGTAGRARAIDRRVCDRRGRSPHSRARRVFWIPAVGHAGVSRRELVAGCRYPHAGEAGGLCTVEAGPTAEGAGAPCVATSNVAAVGSEVGSRIGELR